MNLVAKLQACFPPFVFIKIHELLIANVEVAPLCFPLLSVLEQFCFFVVNWFIQDFPRDLGSPAISQ